MSVYPPATCCVVFGSCGCPVHTVAGLKLLAPPALPHPVSSTFLLAVVGLSLVLGLVVGALAVWWTKPSRHR
jgi:hypothetical protein